MICDSSDEHRRPSKNPHSWLVTSTNLVTKYAQLFDVTTHSTLTSLFVAGALTYIHSAATEISPLVHPPQLEGSLRNKAKRKSLRHLNGGAVLEDAAQDQFRVVDFVAYGIWATIL